MTATQAPRRNVDNQRMNTARIVVLTIAVGAGGLAAYLASGSDKETQPVQTEQLRTVDVLVAKSDIPLGQAVTANDVAWQVWPADSASSSFIRRDQRPDATTQLAGSIARSPFIAGEPIRELKLVSAKGSGFMAAILPTGMRAISTEISPETGAGGFILPNDRVDVILSKREKNADHANGDSVNSETVLGNVRVLAIDQTIEEKNGQKVVVGRTATLELKPEQAETLARSRQMGTLSLALRSLADANAPEGDIDDRRRDSINVVRYGVPTQTSVQR
ncbi:Flp pilus assembly protein CpaB [Nitrobacter winogradskyi]|uniref:Flp pilus assembly protein CpaB n=2 Tax=Nitrobacter winogradskyi TaxID=913 RepID=A0A4Y3WD13_NITWI|nr:Flp pilus assembly protein CpaB [Nitrobacter winogradskyi]